MSPGLFDLLQSPEGGAARVYGVVTGVVTNIQDPEGLGRVKVRFPWLSDTEESGWARCASPMAGRERGVFLLPEVDDEVLVAFEHGDVRFPYVIGALWNADAKPPVAADDKNNLRVIHSRSGHLIRLDDTDGSEKIEIIDKSGKNSITLSTSDNTLTIKADADITLESASGKLILKGNGVEIASQAGVKIEGSQDVEIKSTAQTNVKGSAVNIN